MSRAEENALLLLATAPMPSAYSIYAGNRRDVVADQEFEIRLYEARLDILIAVEHQIRWAVRRIRRNIRQTYVSARVDAL